MSFRDPLPSFLLGKHQMVLTVTFTALFALVFVVLSIPFSHNAWFRLDTPSAFGYTVLFYLIAFTVVIVSKKLMYEKGPSMKMSYSTYVLWNLAEIIIVSVLYSVFTIYGEHIGLLDLQGLSGPRLFASAVFNCIICMGVPYLLSGQYFALNEKNNTIRLLNFSSVVSDTQVAPAKEQKITLFDNNGVLKLVVSSSNLYYIESDDNYIKVWYSDENGDLKMYMLRCKLKTVEDSFLGSDLVRCHRKYMVNVSKINTLTREKEGYFIGLGLEGVAPIPVSRTYEENLLGKFNSR